MLLAHRNIQKMYLYEDWMKILSSMGGEYMIMSLGITLMQLYLMKRHGETERDQSLYILKMSCLTGPFSRMEI